MGPVVRSLILKGFRSLPSVRIEFDNPTFLVGRNGSGKSNIADAFAFLREAMLSPLQEVFDRRGGIANILHKGPRKLSSAQFGMAIHLDHGERLRTLSKNFDSIPSSLVESSLESSRYAFEINALEDYRYEISREQCIIYRPNGKIAWFERRQRNISSNVGVLAGKSVEIMWHESLALPHLLLTNDFLPVFQILNKMRVYSIEPARVREMQDPDDGKSLRRDGSNAASVLEEVKRRVPLAAERIEQFLSAIVPDITGVSTIHHGQKVSLQFTQQWDKSRKVDFEAFNMSDGTLRAFGLLLAIFQREIPSLIVVEEPEASIHPSAAGAILDLLQYASKHMQIIVSTHSPEILDAKWIEDKHLRVVAWQRGATHVSNISELSKKALQQHLMGAGELLRSEALESDTLFEDVEQLEPNLFEEVG